jgi:hypothetical protein
VISKDANQFERQTRWWSVAVRSRAATSALLRKAARARPPQDAPWVRQMPNGIRA